MKCSLLIRQHDQGYCHWITQVATGQRAGADQRAIEKAKVSQALPLEEYQTYLSRYELLQLSQNLDVV